MSADINHEDKAGPESWAKNRKENIGTFGLPHKTDGDVKKILGEKAYQTLHGTQNEPEETEHREAFIQAIAELGENQLFTDTFIKYPAHSLDTIGGKKRFNGKTLKELYEAAILEERNSRNYKNAVFLRSTAVYAGGHFEKQRVILVAGPSGSGKTSASRELVETISQGTLDKSIDPANIDRQSDQTHHIVVTVDGGIEREISEVRDLMNKAALKMGFAGISDLESITTKAANGTKLKKHIEDAANTAGLHLVIPTTHPAKDLQQHMSPHSKKEVSFANVHAKPALVRAMSQSRAFAKKGKRFESIDNIKDAPESKAPGNPFSFLYGAFLARIGEREYAKRQRQKGADPLIFQIKKDLIFVKKIKDAHGVPIKWERCKDNDPEREVMSERQFKAWENDRLRSSRVETWPKRSKKELITVAANTRTVQEIIELQQQEVQTLIHNLKTQSLSKDNAKLHLRILRTHPTFNFQHLLSLFENAEPNQDRTWMSSKAAASLVADNLKKQLKIINNPNTSLKTKASLENEMNTLLQQLPNNSRMEKLKKTIGQTEPQDKPTKSKLRSKIASIASLMTNKPKSYEISAQFSKIPRYASGNPILMNDGYDDLRSMLSSVVNPAQNESNNEEQLIKDLKRSSTFKKASEKEQVALIQKFNNPSLYGLHQGIGADIMKMLAQNFNAHMEGGLMATHFFPANDPATSKTEYIEHPTGVYSYQYASYFYPISEDPTQMNRAIEQIDRVKDLNEAIKNGIATAEEQRELKALYKNAIHVDTVVRLDTRQEPFDAHVNMQVTPNPEYAKLFEYKDKNKQNLPGIQMITPTPTRELHSTKFPPDLGYKAPIPNTPLDTIRPNQPMSLNTVQLKEINETILGLAQLEIAPASQENSLAELLCIKGKDPIGAVNKCSALQTYTYTLEIPEDMPLEKAKKYAQDLLATCDQNTKITAVKIGEQEIDAREFQKPESIRHGALHQ